LCVGCRDKGARLEPPLCLSLKPSFKPRLTLPRTRPITLPHRPPLPPPPQLLKSLVSVHAGSSPSQLAAKNPEAREWAVIALRGCAGKQAFDGEAYGACMAWQGLAWHGRGVLRE
jgi:hypothetical protein